jgi:hypothetical protein
MLKKRQWFWTIGPTVREAKMILRSKRGGGIPFHSPIGTYADAQSKKLGSHSDY